MRAVDNSKAYPTAFRATPPVIRLVLSGTTIKGKRHESVMSIVMFSSFCSGKSYAGDHQGPPIGIKLSLEARQEAG